MMRQSGLLALVAASICPTVSGQSQADLSAAVSKFPQLSSFNSLLGSNPNLLGSLISSGMSQGVTLLIPSNDAFDKYTNKTGSNVTSLPPDTLSVTLQYHIMAAPLTSANFSSAQGIIVPTLVTNVGNNNRTAGAALINTYGQQAAQGQVLFVSKSTAAPGKFRVKRQQGKTAQISGGDAQGASMNAIDAQWSGGYFQIIDEFLVPPTLCSTTIRDQGTLGSLDNALNRTSLWDTLNHLNNVTCLGPNNSGFANAGNPDSALNTSQLTNALLNHTVGVPLYTPYLVDGMVVPSLGAMNITITLRGGDIYFNDAKVVQPNVLTNNGLIHVLDKVMSDRVIDSAQSTTTTTAGGSGSSTTPGATSSSAAVPTQSSEAAGSAVGTSRGGLLMFAAGLLVLL